jgi:hypothetical protein
MWADVTLADQLPNGGAVVAVITVVGLFLRHVEKSNETLRGIATAFTAETIAARAEYRDHMTAIMSQGLAAHRETREAIHALDATLAGIGRTPPPPP